MVVSVHGKYHFLDKLLGFVIHTWCCCSLKLIWHLAAECHRTVHGCRRDAGWKVIECGRCLITQLLPYSCCNASIYSTDSETELAYAVCQSNTPPSLTPKGDCFDTSHRELLVHCGRLVILLFSYHGNTKSLSSPMSIACYTLPDDRTASKVSWQSTQLSRRINLG